MLYHSLLVCLSLLASVGLAAVPAGGDSSTSSSTPSAYVPRGVRPHTPKRHAPADADIDTAPNSTVKTVLLSTLNYFPDPAVHCSGRKLTDAGAADYAARLTTAVTATTAGGLYGACNVDGATVDGYGSLAWRSGAVQVYYCNHGFAATDCDVNEYWRADALLDDRCGADGGGWVAIADWSLTIGRDPTEADGSFRAECGSSLHGVQANFVVVNATRAA